MFTGVGLQCHFLSFCNICNETISSKTVYLQCYVPVAYFIVMYLLQNQSHCTRTGFKTIENRDKPLFLKELSKLWKNNNTKFPWKVGDYDKSNTLLLDDSPYKALQNPVSSHNLLALVLLAHMFILLVQSSLFS